ncbi:putative transcriptional regulator [Methanococcus maripaludis]|uniref:Putative transcriptional regulator n=1 Tax=Methanococcus maripaludis TaxID=39152 RepID=A0A7J9P6D6_METMI|nr:hypothetical protein [Methanococcus maripaludis]MBA2858287.1 putative transcriptional regulator [Methanococcus maripaludis]
MTLKEFSDAAMGLTKNPLGIIGLFITLVYGLGALVTISPNLEGYQRSWLIIFIIIFPFVILGVFYRLVTKYHDKLYAPSDFQNEEHFVNLVNKVDNLESIMEEVQKVIDDQPLYKYSKLTEEGIRIILRAYDKEVNLDDILKDDSLDPKIAKEQISLLESYGWIIKEGNIIKITEKGRADVSTFQELTVARLG